MSGEIDYEACAKICERGQPGGVLNGQRVQLSEESTVATNVTYIGDDYLSAVCGDHEMRRGRHYATFTLRAQDDVLMLGVVGAGFGVLPQLYAGVGADLACCAIVRDQLRHTTRRLEQLVSSSVASQTEPAFDYRETMAELHRLTQHSAQCERASGSILLIAGYAYALCGALISGLDKAVDLKKNSPLGAQARIDHIALFW